MKKFFFLMMLCLLAVAQALAQRTVTGKVTDESGEGLPGVNVLIKGTATGTQTDLDGNYRLALNDGDRLVYSYVGFETQEVDPGTRTVVDLTMGGATELQEVVVTAYGIEKEKRALGYSITQIGSKDITQGPSTNMTSSLAGKLAGVQVTGGTGQPGSSTNVVIRGYANIGRSTNPLYVIDGVPVTNVSQNYNTSGADVNRTVDFGNGINDINAADIESMSILRGSAATALYGSAGSNGVIMITTKKGAKNQDGRPRVALSSSVTFSNILRSPKYQKTFGQGWDGHFASEENGNWGPEFTNDQRLWGNVVNNSQQFKDFSYLEDQYEDFYETGQMFENSISVSGGGDNGTYYISYNNLNSDGIVPRDKDSFEKHSFKFGASREMGFLNVSTSFNYIHKETQAIPTGQGQGGAANLFSEVLQTPTDISLADMEDYRDPNSFNNPNNYYTPYLYNPYFVIDNTSNEAVVDRMIASTTINADIYEPLNLTGTVRAGADVQTTFANNYDARFLLDDNSVNKGTQNDIEGYYREIQRRDNRINLDAFLQGGKQLSSTLSLNMTVGLNMYSASSTLGVAEVNELVLQNSFPNLANTNATPAVAAGYPNDRLRRQAVYSMLELNYKDFLYVTGTARNSWSSTLPKGNNSYFYPSVNASVVLSDAIPVLSDIRQVDYVKLRAGYGQSGNDAPIHSVNPVYILGQVTAGIPFSDLTFPLAGATGYEYSNQLGNPNLKPEISTDMELGLDVVLLANRVNLDFTYYSRKTEGLIVARTLASTSGFSSIVDNIGEITNEGIEISANFTPVKTSYGLTWDLGYKFDKNVNNVVSLTEGLDEIFIAGFTSPSVAAIQGQTVSQLKAFGTQTTDDGQIIVDSQTGRPLATNTSVDLGSTLFDYTMGISNRVSFKNLSLYFLFDYRQGGKFYSRSKDILRWTGKDPLTTFNNREPFVVPNSVYQNDEGVYVENTIPIPNTDLNNYYTGDWNDSAFILDKTFVKLREVNITYNLPSTLLDKIFIESASVSLIGNNLWLWTPTENNVVDPEITTATTGSSSEFGEVYGYPSVRNYGFKVNVNF